MSFVKLRVGIKVHIASNRVKTLTLCGRPIPHNAAETTDAPQDRDKICKACLMIEQEEEQFQQFFR